MEDQIVTVGIKKTQLEEVRQTVGEGNDEDVLARVLDDWLQRHHAKENLADAHDKFGLGAGNEDEIGWHGFEKLIGMVHGSGEPGADEHDRWGLGAE